MTAERWARTVRRQLGLGRLLPLGGPLDGAWITEDAARDALGRAAAGVPGVRLDALRIALADPEDTREPVVPAPPSGLPPGPLRVTAGFAAAAVGEPLPEVAARLRAALSGAAVRVGLMVTEVDLRVTDLLDEVPVRVTRAPEAGRAPEAAPGMQDADGVPEAAPGMQDADGDAARAAAAALAVPGVARLTGVLGGPGGRAVRLEERPAAGDALPRLHARVEIAVAADHRAVEVARAVRAAVTTALRGGPTVAVLVTAV